MDLFLSYAHDEDDAFVARLYDLLRETGRSVWWDQREMASRSLTVMQEIRDAIDGVERVVVVLGPRALASDYVPAEWQHAWPGARWSSRCGVRGPSSWFHPSCGNWGRAKTNDHNYK